VKKSIVVFFLLFAVASGASAQTAIFVGSLGAGYGRLSEAFTQNGRSAELTYSAPGGYMDLELDWDRFYFDMALSILFPPATVTLGGAAVDTSGYELNLGADFTALGIGWLQPLGMGLSLGGSLGFHVSAPELTPPGEDPARLGLGGYYGLIGLSVTPRLRYRIADFLSITLSVPVGLDFSPMSDEVVVLGVDTGSSSPAVVSPAGLKPLFRGWTIGAYLAASFMVPLAR
jgi:hypothetical protein